MGRGGPADGEHERGGDGGPDGHLHRPQERARHDPQPAVRGAVATPPAGAAERGRRAALLVASEHPEQHAAGQQVHVRQLVQRGHAPRGHVEDGGQEQQADRGADDREVGASERRPERGQQQPQADRDRERQGLVGRVALLAAVDDEAVGGVEQLGAAHHGDPPAQHEHP
jgi:hypothetical protein